MSNILQPVKESYRLPAVAGAVVTGAGLATIDATGVRKEGSASAVTVDDRWYLGSCARAMAATLLAVLVEQGRLSWQTSIAELFPELIGPAPSDFAKIVIAQLLTHHSGLPREIDWHGLRAGTVTAQRAQALEQAAALPLIAVPGRIYNYSNLGYVIAAAMAERATGQAWEALMTELVFTPLDMRSAGFGPAGTAELVDAPWGHQKDGSPIYGDNNPALLAPCGRVHCSLPDWAKYIADLLRGLRGEAALLSKESYQRLVAAPFGEEVASGWMLAHNLWRIGPALTHGGSNLFNLAMAGVFPDKDLAILVCINKDPSRIGEAASETVAALYKRYRPEAPQSSLKGAPKLQTHAKFIDYLTSHGCFTVPEIAAAFQALPRELFLPDLPLEQVYTNNAIVTKWQGERSISSSSQPSLMALMLKQLDLKPGHRVLEIGAGTGYNAALMGHIVGATGQITTVDIDADIVAKVEANIAKTDLKNIEVICGDGFHGYATNAPYDRIILTVSSIDVAPAWREQLKPEGALLMPLLIENGLIQKAVLFQPGAGYWQSRSMINCAFMSLRGTYEIPEGEAIELAPGCKLFAKGAALDAASISAPITDGHRDLATTVIVSEHALISRLIVWLRLKVAAALGAQNLLFEFSAAAANNDPLPLLFGQPGKEGWTEGFYRDRELVVLMRAPEPAQAAAHKPYFELALRSFGSSNGNGLAEELMAEIKAWDNMLWPPIHDTLSIRVYPRDVPLEPAEQELISKAKDNNFVLRWQKIWVV